jgi:hypothetical protein
MMNFPEASPQYTPDQDELKLLHNGIIHSLANNPRLNTSIENLNTGLLRRFHTAFIAGMDARTIIGNRDEFDEIVVESRTAPEDEEDPTWVRAELRKHADPEAHRSLTLKIDKDISFHEESFLQPVYGVSKFLPTFDMDDSIYGSYEGDDDNEEDFADFMEEQARAITPDDMDVLRRLHQSLNE